VPIIEIIPYSASFQLPTSMLNAKPLYFLAASVMAAQSAVAQDSPPLQFVTEYVDEFAAVERIRVDEEQALKAPNADMVSICVDSGDRYRRELGQQVARMRSLRIAPPSQDLPEKIADLYSRKLELYQEVIAACSALKGQTVGDVNSLEVMAAVSKYDARVDAVDRELFRSASAVFWTLLQQRSETRKHPSRLVITTTQKTNLLRQIERDFGAELQDEQQTYLVNAGSVIHDYLKSHKASDEP
jgi:hypothetical protein